MCKDCFLSLPKTLYLRIPPAGLLFWRRTGGMPDTPTTMALRLNATRTAGVSSRFPILAEAGPTARRGMRRWPRPRTCCAKAKTCPNGRAPARGVPWPFCRCGSHRGRPSIWLGAKPGFRSGVSPETLMLPRATEPVYSSFKTESLAPAGRPAPSWLRRKTNGQ